MSSNVDTPVPSGRRAITSTFTAFIIGALLGVAGCAQSPPVATVKPVTVAVTASDFCQIMRGLAPPSGKLTWSLDDSPETITGIRRLAAAYDKRCASPRNPSPTS